MFQGAAPLSVIRPSGIKGLFGWGRKKAIFADVQYCIYADILWVGGWVSEKPQNMLT